MLTLTPLEIATILLILVGAAIMFSASTWIRNILRISPESRLFQSWRWLFALTIFFLVGYLGSISLILFGLSNYLLVASGVIFAMGALFVFFVGRVSYHTIEEYQLTSGALRLTTEELQAQRTHLEEQVSLRTEHIEFRASQLQVVSDVARNISMILDTEDLLPAITKLISHRFGYFFTGIYLMDKTRENLILSAASSGGGKNLATHQNAFVFDTKSLFGLAATTGELKLSTNIETESEPASDSISELTNNEVAIPLQVGDEIIGVLDVQHDKNSGFTDDDLSILRTLASLIAIAIQNARSFDQLRSALTSAENDYQQVIQRGWQQVSRKTSNPGYRYAQKTLAQIKDLETIENLKAKASGEEVISPSAKNEPATITVPIKHREQVIGVLNISSTIDRQNWSADEIALVRAIADRGGQALENARLLGDSQQRASRELIIGEISARVTSSIKVESILRTAAEELSRALSGSEVLIQLNPGSQAD